MTGTETPAHATQLYANFGPLDGPIANGQAPSAIGILAALDGPPMVVGIAYGVSFTPDRRGKPVATWRLVLKGEELPGRWVCVGRRFIDLADWQEAEAIRGE